MLSAGGGRREAGGSYFCYGGAREPGDAADGRGEQTLFISTQVARRCLVTACSASLFSHS